MENRVSRLEGAYEQVSDRLNAMDDRLNVMDGHIQGFRDEVGRNFRWIMGAIGGSWATIMIALLLHR